jgi:hypothetical protein
MTTLAFSRRPSLAFSDFGSDDEEHIDINDADYSTRMGELFDDEDETPAVSLPRLDPDEDGETDEAFIYDGVDAQVSRATYREQLRDVLDEDGEDDDDDELEEREVERSLVHDIGRPPLAIEDEALVSPLPLFVPIRHACSTLISHGRTPSPSPLALSRCHALVISPRPRRHFPPPPPPPPSPHHPQCPPSYQMAPPFQHPQNSPRPSYTRLPRVYALT